MIAFSDEKLSVGTLVLNAGHELQSTTGLALSPYSRLKERAS